MAEQTALAPNSANIVPDKVGQATQTIIELKEGAKDLSSSATFKEQKPNLTTQTHAPYVPTYSLSSYFQGLGLLFLILALLWFAVRLLKRYGRFNFLPRPSDLPKDALRMEAQLPLGPRKGLMVVRFLHKRLLLGVTDQQISLLTWERIDDGNANFEELMAKASQAKDQDL